MMKSIHDEINSKNSSNKMTFFIIVIVLILVLIGSVILYKKLSSKYEPTINKSNGDYTLAADFKVKTADGTEVKLSDNFGKPIVVNVWATWCGPCVNELPHFQKMYDEMGDQVTFMFVDLNESPATVQNFMSSKGYDFPIYYDVYLQKLKSTYGVNSIPTTLFINKNGELVHRQYGAMSESTLRSYIDLIVAEDRSQSE